MHQEKDYKLCGGTFLTLLIHAKKYSRQKAANAFRGNSNKLSDVDLLCALIKIAWHDFDWMRYSKERRREIQKDCSHYKLCERDNVGPASFKDHHVRESFDQEIRTNYQQWLIEMAHVVTTFIDKNKEQDLVKALIEVIGCDRTIQSDQQFFCLNDGGSMTKTEIYKARELCIEAFLLGVWHYIIECVPDNTSGKETIDQWCPKENREKGSRRVYTAAIGENSSLDIITTHFELTNNESSDDLRSEDSDVEKNLACNKKEGMIPSEKNNLSEADTDLMEQFKNDYDDVLIQCISTDFTFPNHDFDMFDHIDHLNEIWDAKVLKINNKELRKTLIETIHALSELSSYHSEQLLREADYIQSRDPLSFIQSEEEGKYIKEKLGPETRRLRFLLKRIYKELHPEQYPDLQSSDMKSDDYLFELFKTEADHIITDCIKTDFTVGPIDGSLSDRICCLVEMWESKCKSIGDQEKKKLILSSMDTLSACEHYLSNKYMRSIETPHGWCMIPRNESNEERTNLKDELRPKTFELRRSLRLLYKRLYTRQEYQ